MEVGKEIAVDELRKQHFAILKKLSKLDKNLIFMYFFSSFSFSKLVLLCFSSSLTDASMTDAMSPSMPQETTGIPPQGAQVVPVYQGLKPKKPVVFEGKL